MQRKISCNGNLCNWFSTAPPKFVYSFDDRDDQVAILKKLITDCINIHAPLKTVKLKRLIAPWMHDPKVIELQKELASQRETCHNHETSINHKNYQSTRNKLKNIIKETKANSLCKALSDKQPTVHRILNKQHDRIKLHPSDLNTHFTTFAWRLTHKDNEPHDFTDLLDSISEESQLETFKSNTPTTMKLEKSYLE